MGIKYEQKTIEVNTENFQTNKPGIFAVGDICHYPGKLKLFFQVFMKQLCLVECFKRASPREI